MTRNISLICVLLLLFGMTRTASAAACDTGLRLVLELEVKGDAGDLRHVLEGASRLREEKGACFQSLARLEGLVAEDKRTFERILRAEGYYGGLIDHATRRKPDEVTVRLIIVPGKAYPVATLEVETGPGLRALALKGAAPLLKAGDTARSAAIVAAENAAVTALAEAGYPLAAAGERNVVVDHAARKVAVTYRIEAGAKLTVGNVRFDGLKGTKTGYLERLKPWKKDEAARPALLAEYQKRLQATGLFRVALVNWADAPNEDGSIDVTVNAEEAAPRRIELGAGYSTGEGFELEASWTHRNIGGTGNLLKGTMIAGESEQSLAGEWRKPHFLRYGQTLIGTGKIGREHLPAYTAHLSEAFLGLERRLSKRVIVNGGASFKATDIRADGGGDTFVLATLPMGLAFDGTDNLLDPHQGIRANLHVEPGVSVIDDNYFFTTNELKVSTYWRKSETSPLTLAARVRLGTIVGPSQDQVPLTERFFAGGGGSVRGFSYQGIGAKDAEGNPLGGRSVFEMAFEARARVSETLGLVAFLDSGAVYTERWPQFNDLRFGTGIGLRYHTSFAPLRIDIATPLDRRTGESRIGIYIGMGQSF